MFFHKVAERSQYRQKTYRSIGEHTTVRRIAVRKGKLWAIVLLSVVMVVGMASMAMADASRFIPYGYVQDRFGTPSWGIVKVQCYQGTPQVKLNSTFDPGPTGYWQLEWDSDEGDTLPGVGTWCRMQAQDGAYGGTQYCSPMMWFKILDLPGEFQALPTVQMTRPYSFPSNCAMWK